MYVERLQIHQSKNSIFIGCKIVCDWPHHRYYRFWLDIFGENSKNPIFRASFACLFCDFPAARRLILKIMFLLDEKKYFPIIDFIGPIIEIVCPHHRFY